MCVPDHGHVLKVLNTGRVRGHVEPIVIDDIAVFAGGQPVIGLRIYNRRNDDRDSARLIVMSRGELRSLPLHRCGRKTTCSYEADLLTHYLP